ncbi:MAG TPA: cytochrome c biogenesis protein CcsA [Anaerolineaceae bacterium]|nr:cytochrome c biogenesis protein CcsA [Anaerolineaceae bacterium]
MIANIGYLLLVLGVVCSVLAVLICLWALIKKVRSFVMETRVLSAIGTLAVVAAFALAIVLLVSGRFDYEIVYENTSRQMDLLQKVTAVWGNKSGSLLFWSFLLSICTSVVAFGKWQDKKEPYFHGVMLLLQLINLFFVALITFQTNPFARLWQLPNGNVAAAVFAPASALPFNPGDGQGLNPLLKHLGMVIHPPLLYLGFILFFVPFAFALVSLWRRDYSFTWLNSSRTWIVLAWVFLTAGILLGCWWAYDILGWGGYWSWDPVEIAGLMPWLSGLGLLHCFNTYRASAHVRRWAYVWIVLTVLLIIFGIYLSRTGVVTSVHAYSQSSIGPAFMGFFIFLFVLSIGTLVARWKDLRPEAERPSYLSQAGLACTLSLCMALLVLVCLVGVTLPLTSQALTGSRTEPSQLYYEWSFAPPLLVVLISIALGYLPQNKSYSTLSGILALVFTIGVGLSLGKMNFSALVGLWVVFFLISALLFAAADRLRRSSSSVTPKKRFPRLAGIVLHLGFALLALGVVGSRNLADSNVVSLQAGQSTALDGMQVTKTSGEVEVAANQQVLYAEEYVFQQDNRRAVVLHPHILWYDDTRSTVSSPAIHSTLLTDTYAAILEWDGFANGTTTVLLSTFPLMAWLWIGGVLLMLGTVWLHVANRFSRKDDSESEVPDRTAK